MDKKCYYCNEPSKTKEHVPPKCLFPEKVHKNYRINLIKVPSCDLHNSAKSGDDQYMMVYFAARARGLDYQKLKPHIDKTVRTILRKPHFLSEFSDQLKFSPTRNENREKTNWYAPENHVELKSNYPRICSFLASVARGVLFQSENRNWDGGVLVIPHFLGELITDDGKNLTEIGEYVINPSFSAGDNKEIFYFQVESLVDENIKHRVDMCFYNEFKVSCFFVSRSMRERVESQFRHIEFVAWTDFEPK
jgi:hypothetical protein